MEPIEMEIETTRIMVSPETTENEMMIGRLDSIDELKEERLVVLQRTAEIQEKRKVRLSLPQTHDVAEGNLVLLYDSRYATFPGKLHARLMGPYRVQEIFKTGSLQLEDL